MNFVDELDVDVAVIGGGPAGIAAAVEAARSGLAVALVDSGPIGGRATWSTLLPWRCLERAATRGDDFAAAKREAARLSARWSERAALRLADAGVEVLRGHAAFLDEESLAVDEERRVRFEQAIVCAGAAAATLEGAGPDGERIVRPGELMKLDELPDELLVVGGGAAGAELVDALSRMGGIQITWVAGPFGLLPRFDRELAEAVGDVLMERGVKIVHGKRVDRIERLDDRAEVTLDGGHRYWAPLAVLALGSEPRLERLQLDRAGIEQLRVDERCRVSDRLLAAGECTGRATSAAAAEAMGRCAGRVAAGSAEARYRPERVPLVARTTPTIAQVGSTPEQVAGREVIFYTLRLEETLHGLLEGVGENDAAKGLIRVVCDSDNGALLGATAIGPSAVEAVSGVALALELGADDSRLSEVFAATPSRVDALVRATR